ncbi:phenylalanine--tRNA ligase subunit beta [Candidatus Woesearchaeota archaeon]|nr:phenylalanine--tRNA ligase subunit beta [Candidatus Woesearchaeota archaeon]
MPTITINQKILEQLVGKILPLEELKDRISMLGTDLEGIENGEIQVEIFPNRPDMLSEQGFARALSSFIGVKTGLQTYPIKESGCKVIVDQSVTMRPYTACAIVKDLVLDDERVRQMIQLQEKLATTHGRNRKKSAYGIYPLNHITFPLSYTACDPRTVKFKPLGFTEEIAASEVLEFHPKGKMYHHLTKEWTLYPFFIDAKDNILSMLPFTNSEDTGKVDEKTTKVFIECTGTDQQNVEVALNIITTALADMGGKISSVEVVYPEKMVITPRLEPRRMNLDKEYINKVLGLALKEKELTALLERMGYGWERGAVLVPSYRADIIHQADLAEDIAIAYGYENFTETIPNVATIGEEHPLEVFSRKLRETLVGLQLLEVKNYHLLPKEEAVDKMHLSQNTAIPLKNALGDHNHLRQWLLPSLIRVLRDNQHYEYPQNLFEIGRTFFRNTKTETGIEEKEHCAVAFCHEKTDFTEIRQALDVIFTAVGKKFSIVEKEHNSFIRGRVGTIVCQGKDLGLIGEISPEVLSSWGITMPLTMLEIDVETLFEIIKSKEKNGD